VRLHTSLIGASVYQALYNMIDTRRIASAVELTTFTAHRSRSRPYGYELRLGAYDNRHKNRKLTGQSYAATYDEWGWFIASVYLADPYAVWGSSQKNATYANLEDFNRKTHDKFMLEERPDPRFTRITAHP
jgi:hypothetical protein